MNDVHGQPLSDYHEYALQWILDNSNVTEDNVHVYEGKLQIHQPKIYFNPMDSFKYIIDGINGDVSVRMCGLKTLVGSPKRIMGDFDVSRNELTSLEGCGVVDKDFSCTNNKLKSLIGAPNTNGSFDCSMNPLKTLEGAPTISNIFDCSHSNITNLNFSPRARSLVARNCKLKSLRGLIGSRHVDVSRNPNLKEVFNVGSYWTVSLEKTPFDWIYELPFDYDQKWIYERDLHLDEIFDTIFRAI
jgi:hypothetical protein